MVSLRSDGSYYGNKFEPPLDSRTTENKNTKWNIDKCLGNLTVKFWNKIHRYSNYSRVYMVIQKWETQANNFEDENNIQFYVLQYKYSDLSIILRNCIYI